MIRLLHRATQSGMAILSQCKQGDFAESHRTAKQRDASPACATVCVEKIISTARCLFRGATAEERGVMLGASLSPTAYKIHRNAGKQDPLLLQVCPWCKSRLTQGWKKKGRHCWRLVVALLHVPFPRNCEGSQRPSFRCAASSRTWHPRRMTPNASEDQVLREDNTCVT